MSLTMEIGPPAAWLAKVDALLEEALDLPPGERVAFLAAIGDTGLRAEVAELVGFAATGGIDDGASADNATTGDALLALAYRVRELAADEVMPDRRAGAYRLVERLGEGGMGVVYRAERADGAFEQTVALKLLPAGTWSADAVRLFEQERQILARLSHDHIARLLDGGVDSLGRPFLAMELVDGLPIDRYCDERGLDVDARLALFGDVCRAVQFSHQHLVVHRDLKPSNILVTHSGVVKLLDFGIAKVLAPAEEGLDSRKTGGRTVSRLLSPSYASPEQIAGQPATTSCDIYSLGVVLYQLLAGRLPFAGIRGAGPFPQLNADPTPASAAVFSVSEGQSGADGPDARAARRGTLPDKLRRLLAGDLDAVLTKALARDPEGRYASAEQLGDDLRRWRENLPVEARPNGGFYRLRKWIHRHAVVAALTAAVALAIGLGVVIALWQARAAERAQAAAEHEAAVARQISETLVGVFENARTDAATEQAIVETLLEPSLERIRHGFADSPEVKAALLEALGRAYLRLGRFQRAMPLAEEALELRLQIHPRRHRAVATSQRLLGQLESTYGALDRSAELLRESLETFEQVAADEPLELAEAETLYSNALGVLGDDAGSEALRRRALARYRRHLGERHPQVAQALNHLAQILIRQGAAAEAADLLRQALAIYRATGAADRSLAAAFGNLAQAELDVGRLEAAEEAARDGLAAAQRAYGPDHPGLAQGFDVLARVLVARGQLDEAEPLATDALAIYAAAYPGPRTRTALMAANLAEIALARCQLVEAEARVDEARSLLDRGTPARHLARSMFVGLEGRLRHAQGRVIEAQPLLQRAFDELRARQAPASLALRQSASTLWDIHVAEGDCVTAEEVARYRDPPDLSASPAPP
jgi:serine/threonine protein kinase